ncbi:BAHD family acyltransferase, clade V [Selaginella moellendorffii]|uniref:BAHD family acyltransferase, clade V n=1 Tax=Selaginella moellendorffii TaxID=88036 RepID=D8T4B2_SELML|nr:omega-hydroxypalmitate O-feruloyl transferase [Selaginella moellendorffii]EFJ08498.1 BAHD family acyltransferase, clade V [Selaginella moellendorffii]|eukprot:XP_002990405.1 omega-hydroxypalmitate O-feruloyl transferase [Selaginella moellendorffii]
MASAVRVHDVSRIVPKDHPADHAAMFLCNMDQRLGFYVRNLFFYAPESGKLDTDRLKSSLAELLDSYHFWAGRLRFNHSGRMEIVCSNAGALLALASSSLSVDRVTPDHFDDFFFLDEDKITALEDLPLLTVQVTHLLGDDGYAIGMLIHHTLADAIAGMTFLLNFASVNRGDGLYMAPNGDRTRLRARDPPRVAFQHREFAKQTDHGSSRFTLTQESVLSSESRRRKAPKKSRKTFVFSSSRLLELKQAVLDDGTLPGCSTFEALAAFIWRAHALSLPGKSSSDVLRLRFMVDTRSVLEPPLGQNFCGNAAYGAFAELTLADLRELPLSSIAGRVQEAKRRVSNEYVRSGWDYLELHPDAWYHHDCETMINAWPRLMRESLELDFGWGKPRRVEYPLDPRNSSVIFFPLISDGIQVSVCLDSISLATFEKLALISKS